MKNVGRESNKIIHVSIRSSLTKIQTPLSTNRFVYSSQFSSSDDSHRKSKTKIKSSLTGIQNPSPTNRFGYSTQSWSSDDRNLSDDYHRKSKKKIKSTLKIVLCYLLLTLILIAVLIILIILLTRSPSNKINKTETVVLRWNSSGITVAGNGTLGIASNQLNKPWDLTFDWNNSMYVTDRYNHRVQKFFRGSSIGITIAGNANGNSGTTLAEFNEAVSIEVDADQNLCISERLNCRVLFWPKNTLAGHIIAGNGICGNSVDRLDNPYGLYWDHESNIIYVSDHWNFRVMRYLLNGTGSGTLVAGGNGAGGNRNQLNYGVGVFVNKLTNSLFIANSYTHSILRFSIGINNWTSVVGNNNGLPGSSSSEFKNPSDVMFDPMDNIYVADRYNNRIQFFLPSQLNGTTIAGVTNVPGSNSTLLNGPTSIRLDNQLNLYVVDQNNHRVQKFLRY